MPATLVLGGTRSGKSAHAEGLLPADVPVRYCATARRIPGDAEWDARIAAHVARRPAHWATVEAPDLVAELAQAGAVMVDDLATWLTGVLDDAQAWTATTTPPPPPSTDSLSSPSSGNPPSGNTTPPTSGGNFTTTTPTFGGNSNSGNVTSGNTTPTTTP